MHSSKRSIPIFELLPIHHDFTMKDIISEQLQKNKLFKSLRYILLQRKMLVFSAFCTKIRVIPSHPQFTKLATFLQFGMNH